MPGRMVWDEARGELVEEDAAAGADADAPFAPLLWDDAKGELVAQDEARPAAASAPTSQPHAKEETASLWDTFMRLPARVQEMGERFVEEDIAAGQGAYLNYLDDMIPAGRDRIERATRQHPDYHAAGTGATAGLVSAMAPGTIPMQAAAGAATAAGAARGRGADWGETAGDAALGGVVGAAGQLYAGGLQKAFGHATATPTRTPSAPAPSMAAAPLREVDDWLINMNTPTAEAVEKAGWLEGRPEASTAAPPAIPPGPRSVRPPRTSGAPGDLPEGFARTEEVVPADMSDVRTGAFDDLGLTEEQLAELSQRSLSRGGRPTRIDETLAPRDTSADFLLHGQGGVPPGMTGRTGLPFDRQAAGTGPMPYDEFASNAGQYKPQATDPIRDQEIAGLMSGRTPPASMPPSSGRLSGPPRPPIDPSDLPPPELELTQSLRRARATELPPPGGPMDLSDVDMPMTTREAVVSSTRPRRGMDPDVMESLGGFRLPGRLQKMTEGVPELARASTNAAGGSLLASQREQVAYADAPTLSWGVQTVLAEGVTRLSPEDQSALTRAITEGDDSRVAALHYRFTQQYPAYARRIEETLRQLNEEN